ncbi:hypothetical protein [Micromonospora thermarum]|uniref:Uncharacterized protein n=1 Tax=Micromonospora thermarum TaxID=2720024 RepID=A0ABX0ZHK0_9ACTN|nr:hypothetical protein [Micromonospora thermarum]NJP35270.1 hypothetical protein [Micromonospora thermarum]
MLVLPIDGGRGLLVLAAATPQFKDKENGVAATDRATGAPLVEVPLALTADGGTPQVLRVSVPQPSVPKDLAVGQWVKATGLTLVAGEKNGRPWQIFRASALTAVKPG